MPRNRQNLCYGTVRETRNLTDGEWEELWGLARNYLNTSFENYRQYTGRSRTSETLIWRHRLSREVVGTACIDVSRTRVNGQHHTIVYTSSTIIHEAFRSHNLLQIASLKKIIALKLRRPFEPIHWVFASTHKSYLVMARTFRHYWPRPGREMPGDLKKILDAVMCEFVGNQYQPELGIARLRDSVLYKPDVTFLSSRDLHDPLIKFYSGLNPEAVKGDFVACLCPLTLGNILHLVGTAAARALRKKKKSPGIGN